MNDCLSKADVTELKAFKNPPEMVIKDWKTARKALGDAKFLEKLIECDGSRAGPGNIQSAKTMLESLEPARVVCVSKAACSLTMWANSIVSRNA